LSEALLSLLRDGSRDRAAVESRLRSGDVRFTERIQVEHADGTTRVTDVFATAAYRAAPSTSLSISYDRQRTLALRDEVVPFDQALREALRQGLRASIDVQTKSALGGYVSGGLRMQEAEVEHAWSASGGVRHPRVLGLSASADASYYVNHSTSGVLATARAGRVVHDRHSIDLSYVYSSYALRAATDGDRRTVSIAGLLLTTEALITDLPEAEAGTAVTVAGLTLPIAGTYEQVEPGEVLAYIGSAGTVEIGVRDGRADRRLSLARGGEVVPAPAERPGPNR
jgi:hypothetical protein